MLERSWFPSFSALQRAEIAEIFDAKGEFIGMEGFSALQRAEIAEMSPRRCPARREDLFQCSSTSRNC